MNRVALTIYEQLGGDRFVAMTGAKGFVADENTLRISIGRNASKANRVWITLDADDTYTMRFFRYTAPRYDGKTGAFKEEKITEVAKISNVYCDQLQSVFTGVTGLYTRF